jgi:hypothetical protein
MPSHALHGTTRVENLCVWWFTFEFRTVRVDRGAADIASGAKSAKPIADLLNYCGRSTTAASGH